MTNGEKLQETFPNMRITVCESYVQVMGEKYEFNNTYPLDWWNAEYKEPTTKNEAKYCDRNICLKNEYNNVGCEDCEVTKSQEPTTKNDLGVASGLEKNSKKLENPTTKDYLGVNYLGVDCISREQALRKLKESAEHHANDSREEVLLRRDRDIIRALPPATPQEPRWIPVSERLPEEHKEVIASDVFGVYIGEFIDAEENWGGKHFVNEHGMHSKSVTAWMPLPEPYKAESEA